MILIYFSLIICVTKETYLPSTCWKESDFFQMYIQEYQSTVEAIAGQPQVQLNSCLIQSNISMGSNTFKILIYQPKLCPDKAI